MTHSGPYYIDMSAEAKRALHRLPAKIAPAVVEFITGALADNPTRLSKQLTNELAEYRSARRGDYRVLIRIDETRHTVLVSRIDHRADVYHRR